MYIDVYLFSAGDYLATQAGNLATLVDFIQKELTYSGGTAPE